LAHCWYKSEGYTKEHGWRKPRCGPQPWTAAFRGLDKSAPKEKGQRLNTVEEADAQVSLQN
jgi:hypothetical protein